MTGGSRLTYGRLLRTVLPFIGLLAVCAGLFSYRPNAASYVGLNLLLMYVVPVALAACSQMFVIAAGDIDLSIGTFVSLITCIVAVILPAAPLTGYALLAALVVLYAGIGVLIHVRRLPSIVVTLGCSFVWLGAAVLILPTPGGQAPDWISEATHTRTPFVPLPVWILVLVSLVSYLVFQRWSYGTILRAAGGNPAATRRAGWSVAMAKGVLYAIAGCFGVLSGIFLTGLTSSGDANIAPNYTLLSVAAVILGGGDFVGGRIAPIGTVVGAVTLVLMNSLLTFMNIASGWQLAAQGLILIAILATRTFITRFDTRSRHDVFFAISNEA